MKPTCLAEKDNLNINYEIMSYFVFRSSFMDKGSRVYEYDNKKYLLLNKQKHVGFSLKGTNN